MCFSEHLGVCLIGWLGLGCGGLGMTSDVATSSEDPWVDSYPVNGSSVC